MIRIAVFVGFFGFFALLTTGCWTGTSDNGAGDSGSDGSTVDAGGQDGGGADGSVSDAGGQDGGGSDAGGGDAGVSDGGGAVCSNLNLDDCRHHAECAADLCFACSCTPSFEGCRAVKDPAFVCPAYGCPAPLCCQDAAACGTSGAFCAAPGSAIGCGMCFSGPGDCSLDSDCQSADICEPIKCSCDNLEACTAGCLSDTDCLEAEVCSGGLHPRCEAASCTSSQPCPPDFDCLAGACTRRSCASDLECDHFCVERLCRGSFGQCTFPAP